MTKICTACWVEKPVSEFYKNASSRGKPSTQCKDCTKIKTKEYAKKNKIKVLIQRKKHRYKNKDRMNAYQRKWLRDKKEIQPQYGKNRKLVRDYGITLDEYNMMFVEQKGCCAICEVHQTETKQILCVDHNHLTGQVRQLLCHKCNSTLGFIGENLEILNCMIAYIKKHAK